jgi:transposase
VNEYARSLPYLGFDPAPGDVGLTQHLARRHYEVAQEARQVLAMVARLNLQAWQGRAGDAMRAVQATFPPALRNTVSAAEALHAATSSWASQLSGFQAEADALERQAARASAEQQALQAKQAALPPGSAVLTADLESASAAVSGIHRQAQDLHQRYLAAAAKTAADIGDHSGLWGRTEPVRPVLEAVLAPLDIVAADHWVSALEKVAGVPAEWVKELDNQITEIKGLITAGQSPVQELITAGKLAESTGGKLDAWYAFAPGWLRTAAGSVAGIRGLSYTLSGLGLAADVGAIVSPQDKGALGWADRGVAGFNGALITANLVMDEIPGVGEVMLAASGVYLAGDFLYHHWAPFHDVTDEVGHATVKVADGIGHTARSAWHSVTSSIGSWF